MTCDLAGGAQNAQGDLLFVVIFGAACAVTIVEAIRIYVRDDRRAVPGRDPRLASFVPWDSIGASRRLDVPHA